MGRQIQVVYFADATMDENIVEFVDPLISSYESIVAVFNKEAKWNKARVTISPRVDGVSVEFMEWALAIARQASRD